MSECRYSARNFAWWCGDTVVIMEDKELHKYQLWVKATKEKTDWFDSPELALQNYNSTHESPRWERPKTIWSDWYGPQNIN